MYCCKLNYSTSINFNKFLSNYENRVKNNSKNNENIANDFRKLQNVIQFKDLKTFLNNAITLLDNIITNYNEISKNITKGLQFYNRKSDSTDSSDLRVYINPQLIAQGEKNISIDLWKAAGLIEVLRNFCDKLPKSAEIVSNLIAIPYYDYLRLQKIVQLLSENNDLTAVDLALQNTKLSDLMWTLDALNGNNITSKIPIKTIDDINKALHKIGTVYGSIELNDDSLAKGLELLFSASVSKLEDDIYLPKEDLQSLIQKAAYHLETLFLKIVYYQRKLEDQLNSMKKVLSSQKGKELSN